MIRFLLDTGAGTPEEIALGDEAPPDLTVLDWLRLHRHRTGTKEGCGSGDCGACTVVVASPTAPEEAGPALRHESVNACIAFVGALHGRLLVTVESLARGDELHPVQRAMVEEHGSQCGFCTPGFVMSLYALYRAPDAPRVSLRRSEDGVSDTRGPEDGAGGGRSVPPVDLDRATPVVAHRSEANAEAARRSFGTGGGDESAGGAGAGGEADGAGERNGRPDSSGGEPRGDRAEPTDEGRALRVARPMTSPAGWLEGVVTDDADALSHRIDRTLGGNLCRCTGYRPIKRAAVVALAERTRAADEVAAAGANAGSGEGEGRKGERRSGGRENPGRENAERAIASRLREIAATPPAHSGFHAPDSLADLAALVTRHPDAPLLGGGTDLALEVTQSLRDLPRLIHVARVPELQRVEDHGDALTIGAAVTLTRCLELLADRVPGAAELLLRFGSDPIRNRGTIGGNLGSASPIGDLPPLLLALDATLVLQRGEATREHAVDGYFTGYRETVLARGEFVRAVRVPLPGPDDLVRVYKVSKRMEDDISAVCGAFRLTFDAPAPGDGVRPREGTDDVSPGTSAGPGGTAATGRGDALAGRRVVAARLAFGGMAATPARAPAAEAALTGTAFDGAAIAAAGDALGDDFSPLSDARASAGYRLQVARNLLRRAHLEADEASVPVRLPFGGTTHALPFDRGADPAHGHEGGRS